MSDLFGMDFGNVPAKPGTNNPDNQEPLLPLDIVRRWRSEHRRGLQIRLDTGLRLNQRLGQPTLRLPHRKQILKRVADVLHVAESDLSRMRWFAHLFASVEDLKSKHPQVRSWTDIKELLPGLIAGVQGRERSPIEDREELPSGQRDSAPIGAFIRDFGNATKHVCQVEITLTDAARKHLAGVIKRLVLRIAQHLQLPITIS